jgi:glyoxylase-like metal-dependent hydrolase (beta-lactamase superfamily II)
MTVKSDLSVRYVPGITNRPEFGDMFGGLLVKFLDQNILVDCGTVTGGPDLTARLMGLLDGKQLDLILLTHIHADHMGGLGDLLNAFPKAKAVVHAKGFPHLVNPEKLWQGTLEVMGELAEMYGCPRPVDPARLLVHDNVSIEKLHILPTPGHAAHHLSYRLGGTIFAGEALGCPYLHEKTVYLRPATPPRFYPEIFLNSLDLLEKQPAQTAFFAHTGLEAPLTETVQACRKQIAFWDNFLKTAFNSLPKTQRLVNNISSLTDRLFDLDPNLQPLNAGDPQRLKREKYFMLNSVAGFWDYYAQSADLGL